MTAEEVEQWLQASDVTLYMVGQGRGVTNQPLKKVMDQLSHPTGGRAISTESIDKLHEAFSELLDELSNRTSSATSRPPPPGRCMAQDQGRRRRTAAGSRAAGISK